MTIQVCPFHAEEAVHGVALGDEARTESFTCSLNGHPKPGPWTWSWAPEPPTADGVSGLAAELSLDFELPTAIASYGRRWVEYGLVERAYAHAKPDDFAYLLSLYGHTEQSDAKRPMPQYTVSAYLARTLGDLSRVGAVLFHQGPGTGRWKYNENISYWAVTPEPPWDERLTWESQGVEVDYVSQ